MAVRAFPVKTWSFSRLENATKQGVRALPVNTCLLEVLEGNSKGNGPLDKA